MIQYIQKDDRYLSDFCVYICDGLTDDKDVKGAICKNIMLGDNRLESIGVRLSDAKVRDAYQDENQQVQEVLDKQAKKVASDGVVLEISKSGLNASAASEAKEADKVQQQVQKQDSEKEERIAETEKEQRKIMDTQRVLENINI